MTAPELDIAQHFQSAFATALRTGDVAAVVALLASDVECVTPVHTVHGIDAMIEELSRARLPESLDVEFEVGDWKRLGNGRYSWQTRALVRSMATGELSYTRDRSFELTIRDGQVSRCEMRFVG
ncbi:MAG: nuclear transport factor 2 family protein [Gaiellaceae bacterium]